MKCKAACDSCVSCHTETGRVFTWGRGNYGQLGRHASTSQNSESQLTTDGEKLEACLPAEVEALHRATQVRYQPFLITLKHPQEQWRRNVIVLVLTASAAQLLGQQGAADTHKYNHAAEGLCLRLQRFQSHTHTHTVRALLCHKVRYL